MSGVRVITGATSGIGRALAQQLAAAGEVALVARDPAKGESVRSEIARAVPDAIVEVHLADLSSLADVRSLADQLSAAHPRIDALVNCAAVFSSRRVETTDGLELMFATNHLAPFLLTNLLLPSLRASGAARVLTVTAPATVRLDFDDLQGRQRFRALRAFGATKAANLLFTFGLAGRVAESGVVANAVHPGLARTQPDAAVAGPLAGTHRAAFRTTRPGGGTDCATTAERRIWRGQRAILSPRARNRSAALHTRVRHSAAPMGRE